MKRRTLVLAALLLACSTAALAQGRTPVWLPGTVIGANGSYFVARDIVAAGAAPVITITAPNVDLDLNGHTLTVPGGGPAVISVPAGFSEVRIHNGRLSGGSMSIDAIAGRKLVIEKVHSQDAQGPAPGAFHASNIDDVVIRECTAVGSLTTFMISLDGPVAGKTGVIERNVLESTAAGGSGGIQVILAQAFAILHNRIDATGMGIALDGSGCLVSENTVRSGTADGIVVRQGWGNKLFDNVVEGSAGNGINLMPGAGDTLVLNNVLTMNGMHGLWVQGQRNLVERNTLNGNTGCGLFFTGPQNTFGRNMARGNTGVGCAGCFALFPPESCAAAPGNSSFGDNLIPGPPVF
jgi:parallel beta-helix repeat protein